MPHDDSTLPCGAPRDRNLYLSVDAVDAQLRSQYVRDGQVVANSRLVPADPASLPVGAWLIESFATTDGVPIEEVCSIDVANIEVSEDSGPQKWADIARYAQWLAEGRQAPPIRVLQTESGRLKTMDHRRLLAARVAGLSAITARVSWTTLSERGTPVALTFELAQTGSTPIPITQAREDYVMHTDDREAVKRMRAEFEERQAACDSDEPIPAPSPA